MRSSRMSTSMSDASTLPAMWNWRAPAMPSVTATDAVAPSSRYRNCLIESHEFTERPKAMSGPGPAGRARRRRQPRSRAPPGARRRCRTARASPATAGRRRCGARQLPRAPAARAGCPGPGMPISVNPMAPASAPTVLVAVTRATWRPASRPPRRQRRPPAESLRPTAASPAAARPRRAAHQTECRAPATFAPPAETTRSAATAAASRRWLASAYAIGHDQQQLAPRAALSPAGRGASAASSRPRLPMPSPPRNTARINENV